MIKLLKKLCCKIGWHSIFVGFETWKHPNDPYQFLTFGKCKWCNKEGQIDSQGNLF